ncbi:MAG: short-chain dehydrogenase [Bacteroidetes bacterium]|jgi:NAD(P)-dependent dehydrogenase (short-subunit alcohol dehydrogenase family)|nr:short-chain dehydrogenase [Bacteroidota bacterium]
MLVLVTGASKGIGLEIVKQLANNPGILVIGVSRNITTMSTLVKQRNTDNILPVKADITKAADQKKIVATIKKLGLKLDVLIHNAGELVNKPFPKISEKELRSVYSTNVFAPFLLTQILLPVFNTKNRAHIVNISSVGGVQGSSKFPGLSAYSSSKAALCGLTECLAEELKDKNIAVNCLALGAVQTEMLARAFPGYKAPLKAGEMAEYICNFALTGQNYFNGKIVSVSSTTP